MANKLNMINRFKFSMNPKSYLNFINDKFGKAVLYLLIISVVIGSIESIKAIMLFSTVEKSFQNALKDEDLKFELKDGVLNFESSQLKEEEGQFLLLIDTDKSIEELDSLRSITVHKEVVTVFLKDGFMFKSDSDKKTYKYSEIGLDRVYIDNNILINLISNLKFVKFIIIPLVIIAEFISMLINAFLISIVGVLNVLFSRRKMSYNNIFKLSIYSLTLPLLINMIFPAEGYVVLIGGFMLILAINYINFYKEGAY